MYSIIFKNSSNNSICHVCNTKNLSIMINVWFIEIIDKNSNNNFDNKYCDYTELSSREFNQIRIKHKRDKTFCMTMKMTNNQGLIGDTITYIYKNFVDFLIDINILLSVFSKS